MTFAPIKKVTQLADSIRDDLRERRETYAAYKQLEQELSTYRTPREVDDLLGSMEGQEGPGADQVRDMLLDNLRPRPQYSHAA